MSELVFHDQLFAELSSELLRESSVESAAVLLATPVRLQSDDWRFLVREIRYASSNAYTSRTAIGAELSPVFVASVAKEARRAGKALIFVHTHLGVQQPRFSAVDDLGEQALVRFLSIHNQLPHGALVLSRGGCRARRLGTDEALSVVQIAPNITVLSQHRLGDHGGKTFDRQVRAFGLDGQVRIRELSIGIVGLGGTGSIVAQQLAYLGARKFTLLDPDSIDQTNLNRVVGATHSDIGRAKVEVAARMIVDISTDAAIDLVRGSVLLERFARPLAELDVVFCCTDSHGSRAVLNQLAYQYLVPCFDMGVSLSVKDGRVTHISGRAQMLAPGLGCLTCARLLDSAAIRYDLMSDNERRSDRYFIGSGVPQPAVISLNSTVASLAVSMFLAAYTSIPGTARQQVYDGIGGYLRSAVTPRDPICVVCSKNGALARGDEWSLPTRKS